MKSQRSFSNILGSGGLRVATPPYVEDDIDAALETPVSEVSASRPSIFTATVTFVKPSLGLRLEGVDAERSPEIHNTACVAGFTPLPDGSVGKSILNTSNNTFFIPCFAYTI